MLRKKFLEKKEHKKAGLIRQKRQLFVVGSVRLFFVSNCPIKVKHEDADMTLDPGVWYVAYIPQSQVDN